MDINVSSIQTMANTTQAVNEQLSPLVVTPLFFVIILIVVYFAVAIVFVFFYYAIRYFFNKLERQDAQRIPGSQTNSEVKE